MILCNILPELKYLKDFFKPKYFKSIVEAAKKNRGYDDALNSYIHPSNALKIGYTLTQCAEILQTQMMINNSRIETRCSRFFTSIPERMAIFHIIEW